MSTRLSTRFQLQHGSRARASARRWRRETRRRPARAAGSPSRLEHDHGDVELVERGCRGSRRPARARAAAARTPRPAPPSRRRIAGGGVIGPAQRDGGEPLGARRTRPTRCCIRRRPPCACARAASARCPWRPSAGRTSPRIRCARSLTASSSLEFGTTSSTSRQSTARLPLTPSSVVQNTSAWSRRTLRLSVTRVSPPVPGSTASSGSSGSDTVERAVVDQHDVVGGERQFVAAAGAGAVDDADHALAGESRWRPRWRCGSRW